MHPIFIGRVENGKLKINEYQKYFDYVRIFEGKFVELIIRLPRKPRSDRQNRYYWVAVVGIPAEHYGYIPEEMHEAFKWMFLRQKEQGKPETVRSTTMLSTKEFTEYVEQCRQWAAEQGIVIPDPSQVDLGDDEQPTNEG